MTTATLEGPAEIVLPRLLRVSVTQEDINLGCAADEYWCPVARAIRRLFPSAPVVIVTGSMQMDGPNIWVHLDGEGEGEEESRATYRAPALVGDWICAFDDQEHTMRPFSFEATLADEAEWLSRPGVRVVESN